MEQHINLTNTYNELLKHVNRQIVTYYYNSSINDTREILRLLLLLINNNFNFINKLDLNKILSFLFVRSYTCYYPCKYDPTQMFIIAKYVCDNYLDDIDFSILGIMIRNKKLPTIQKYILTTKNIRGKWVCAISIPFNIHDYYSLGNRYFNENNDQTFYKSVDLLKKIKQQNIIFCDDDIILMARYYIYCGSYLYDYFSMNKIIPSDKIINYILETCTTIQFEKLFNLDIKLKSEYVITACKFINIELILYLLDFNLRISKECINILIDSIIKRKNNSKLYRTELYHEMTVQRAIVVFDKLILHGCELTYDNIVNLTKLKATVPDFEKYNIKLQDDFIETCSQYNYYPYNTHIKHTNNSLSLECSKYGSVKNIQHILEQNPSLKLTQECLENACKIRCNAPVINFIIANSIIPNFNCVKNIINSQTHKSYIINLIATFENEYLKEKDELFSLREKNIKIKEELSILKSKTSGNIDQEFLIDYPEKKIDDILKDQKLDNNTSQNNNTSSNSLINSYIKLDNIPKTFIFTDKIRCNSKIKKLLNITSIKSFIELRRYLLQYIIKNSLLKQNIITLNTDLQDILKIHENTKINFYDIDKLSYLFIKIEK